MLPADVEARWGIPQAEPPDGAVRQAAPFPVGPGAPCLLVGGRELRVEEARCIPVDVQDAAAQAARLVILLGHGHSCPARQSLHCLHIVQIVDLSHKGDGVAAHAAAKAVKALVFRVDHKGRGLFIVKRAQPRLGAAPVPQLHIAADQVHNVGAAHHFLHIFLWDHPITPFC